MLTGSALDYLELTQAFGRDELLLYSAELSQHLPQLFVHLPAKVQAQLLTRLDGERPSLPPGAEQYGRTAAGA